MAGMPLGSQTVLLKGINDDPAMMKSLMQKLLTISVRPYYIYQCDLIPGSSHFRTTIEKGIDIIRESQGPYKRLCRTTVCRRRPRRRRQDTYPSELCG
ncbi:MAG: hypothetical protein MZV63_33205 [Marinilabiliales bacterium]|nr:hypothetical protein [Marinilabiliales bacterium]